MELATSYAVALGGSFILLLLFRASIYVFYLLKPWKHFLNAPMVRRHRAVGPWTYTRVFMQLVYIAANGFCLIFNVSTAYQASSRAAHLSLINLIPTYLGPHHSFICDTLGVSLSAYRLLHRSAATMSLLLAILHFLISLAERSNLEYTKWWDTFGVTVGASLSEALTH